MHINAYTHYALTDLLGCVEEGRVGQGRVGQGKGGQGHTNWFQSL